MPKFNVISGTLGGVPVTKIVREGTSLPAIGCVLHRRVMGCCGLNTIETLDCATVGVGGFLNDWESKASYLSALYKWGYQQGWIMYTLTPTQERGNILHQWFLELGARRMTEFPNLYHGPNVMGVWIVNIRNCEGRVCNQMGEPYEEQPTTEPPPIQNPTENPDRSYVYPPWERN